MREKENLTLLGTGGQSISKAFANDLSGHSMCRAKKNTQGPI